MRSPSPKTYLLIIAICLPIFAEPLNPPSLTSSSQLLPKTKKYTPIFAMDGKLKTSWVEGANGEGIGETLQIKYKSPINFRSLSIYNGFGDPKLWAANNRIKKLKISTEDGNEEIVTLKDSLSLQMIEFKSELRAKEISLTIQEVYKGTNTENTAIAELTFNSEQAGSALVPPKNTWAIGKWKTKSNIARIQLHNDGTCEMGYETAKMLCTWTEKGDKVIVSLEATLPLTNTDILEIKRRGNPSDPTLEINGKHEFISNRDGV
ncbi:nicotine adenine dinucleotide glycohydrolase [Leptospira mtsangambouensis]|uniref:Nicotine adenine dinucleotide glycohydrolase n=1 Tax=Leptospira mtsangambouensis TaxID=2484912 RepID=A0ABY2NY32_9LEPT|nr:discoidin domain-containing protein [Leptospira mtsangambouensis]MCG6139420.1 discoidin domain-containing protein [Leptospira mtsangambouensis]TGM73126.1 nicotine adenine dinucleotide glycohydrolase [Leptospira mtsangambouensis]